MPEMNNERCHHLFPAPQLRALSIAYFVQATGALSVAGSLPAISAAWQLTDAQSARLLSIFGLTFALAAPLVQVLFGHLRRRRLVLTGIALFGLGAFAFVLSPGYNALLASRILMGAGAGFIGPVLVALGSELVHEQQRGRAIGMVLLGVSMASLAGIPIASWVAGLWGAKALFALVGVVSLLSGLNILLTVPDDSAGTRIRLREMAGVLADGKYLTAFLVVFLLLPAFTASTLLSRRSFATLTLAARMRSPQRWPCWALPGC